MFEYAINNEALRRLDFPMPLINLLPIWEVSIMTENSITKVCPKCNIEKSMIEFSKDKKSKDGVQSECKRCAKKYREDHKVEILAWDKEYRNNHKAEIVAYHKEHAVHLAKYQKEYHQTPAGKAANIKGYHKRRALKLKTIVENFNPNTILERDGYRCQLCRKKTRPDYNRFHPLFPNLDHIVPLNKGGPHTKKNTQCLCRQCNLEKNSTGNGDQLRLFG